MTYFKIRFAAFIVNIHTLLLKGVFNHIFDEVQ